MSLPQLSGDPDLFISTTLTRPSASNFTWHSFDYGSDVVTVNTHTDPAACTGCVYYIAVVGAREATYTISV